MNRTATIAPIIAALVKAEDIVGSNRTWITVNDDQRQFIETYFPKRDQLKCFLPQELRSWIDNNVEKLNAILRDEGFTIQLDPFYDNEFGVVSILDVLVEWLVEGEVTVIETFERKTYPAVKLARQPGAAIFSVYRSRTHEYPVAVIPTKSGDNVFMTAADEPESDFNLLARIRQIEPQEVPAPGYRSLTFPMIDLDETVDIGWLKGLKTYDGYGLDWRIFQALQQTKFKMNEKGAHAKSAVGLGVLRFVSAPALHLVIDRPFFLWITRPGISIPIFAAYLDEATWKNPGNLNL